LFVALALDRSTQAADDARDFFGVGQKAIKMLPVNVANIEGDI